MYKLHLRCPNVRTAQVSFCRSLLEGRYPAHRPACLTCFTPSRPAMSYRLPTEDLEDGAQWPSGLGAGKRRCQGSPLALSKVRSRLTQHPTSPQGDMLGHCELNAGSPPVRGRVISTKIRPRRRSRIRRHQRSADVHHHFSSSSCQEHIRLSSTVFGLHVIMTFLSFGPGYLEV